MKECERKFLIRDVPSMLKDLHSRGARELGIVQSYSHVGKNAVRMRRTTDAALHTTYHVNAKSELLDDGSRYEREEEISSSAYDILQPLFPISLTKVRHVICIAGYTWEIDHFLEHNQWMAEIELPAMNTELTIPAWIGDECTTDVRYTSASIAVRGFPR